MCALIPTSYPHQVHIRSASHALCGALAAVLAVAILFASCNEDNKTLRINASRYTITFETNGGSAVNSLAVEPGNMVAPLPAPTRPGYAFGGWYTDAGLKNAFDFAATPIASSFTLYAQWTPGAQADVKIPDTNFLLYLQRTLPADAFVSDSFNPTTGSPGVIRFFLGDKVRAQHPALKKIFSIHISDQGIGSLKGIELFTELTELDCRGNRLTSLDVRRNTALASVSLFSGDRSKNPLTDLKIYESQAGQRWVVDAKRARGAVLKISTYATNPAAPDGYRLVCADYDPGSATCLHPAP